MNSNDEMYLWEEFLSLIKAIKCNYNKRCNLISESENKWKSYEEEHDIFKKVAIRQYVEFIQKDISELLVSEMEGRNCLERLLKMIFNNRLSEDGAVSYTGNCLNKVYIDWKEIDQKIKEKDEPEKIAEYFKKRIDENISEYINEKNWAENWAKNKKQKSFFNRLFGG